MSQINEKGILKGYKKFFVVLMLASAIINAITLFVPVFYIDMGFVKVSESGIIFMGMDYTDDVLDEYEDKYGSVGKDYYNELNRQNYQFSVKDALDVDSDFLDMIDKDTFVWKQILRIVLFIMVFSSIVTLFGAILLFGPNTISEALPIQKSIQSTSFNFWLNTVYMVLGVFICWILLNDGKLEGVMTLTFIPWIFQLIVFISSMCLKSHMRSALRGERTPWQISKEQTVCSSSDIGGDSEVDKAELLIKYKELLDNDVITQEEYDAKKKELL